MTRTKKTTAPDAADSAAHAAPAFGPVPGTRSAPDGPAAAVQAALAARPDGAATTGTASAAGISRAAAGKALAEMETAGTAERTKGERPGIPDTWRPVAAPANPTADTAPADPAHAEGTAASHPAPERQTAGTPGAGGTGSGPDQPRDNEHPGGGAPASTQDMAGEPRQDSAAGTGVPGDGGDATHADGTSDAAAPPCTAVTAAAAGYAGKIGLAAGAVTTALEAGDLGAALAAIEDVRDQAGQARRILKAAAGGRNAPSVKPGALRELVAAHLRAYPGHNFTPHQIGTKLTRSSGAVANALDKLVALGEAELATEKPRSFRLAGSPAAAPASHGTAVPASGDEAADGDAAEEPVAGAA